MTEPIFSYKITPRVIILIRKGLIFIFHLFFQNPYSQGGQGDSGRRPVGNFAAALSKLRKGAAGGHDPSGTSSHFDAYSFQQDQQQQSGTNKRPHDSQGT